MRGAALGALIAGGLLAACSGGVSADRGEDSLSRYLEQVHRTVDVLSARHDGPALFTAAMLAEIGSRIGTATVAASHGSPESVTLARRAVAAAPDDVLNAWIYLSLCAHSPECDTREAAASYRRKNPANLFGWIYDLGEAERASDDAAVDHLLEEMAHSTLAQTHYTATVIRFVETLASLPADVARDWGSEGTRGVTAIGLVGSNLPALGSLARSCKAPPATTPRRATCLRVASLLQRADTAGPQLAGYRIALRLLPPGSPDYARTRAEQRAFKWLEAQHNALSEQPRWWRLHADLDQFVGLLRAHDREEDVLRAELENRHIDPQPPADWAAPAER